LSSIDIDGRATDAPTRRRAARGGSLAIAVVLAACISDNRPGATH
jgi:hypothetical protein